MSTLSPHQIAFLELLVRRQALRFGSFTLKSGRQSPYFINTGCFDQGGDLARLGEAYAAALLAQCGDAIEVVFGPAYKGIPLALATAQAYEQLVGRPVRWCFDRKEAKGHGDGGSFVGAPLTPGTRVAIVDDVMTAGTAIRDSLAKLAPLELDVVAVLISVDRQERGQSDRPAREEISREFGIPVHAILTIAEAVAYLRTHRVDEADPMDSQQAQAILDHLVAAR